MLLNRTKGPTLVSFPASSLIIYSVVERFSRGRPGNEAGQTVLTIDRCLLSVGVVRVTKSAHVGVVRVTKSAHVGVVRVTKSVHVGVVRVTKSAHVGVVRVTKSAHDGSNCFRIKFAQCGLTNKNLKLFKETTGIENGEVFPTHINSPLMSECG